MLSHLEYDSGAGLKLRLRDSSVPSRYWDFAAAAFAATENSNTRLLYNETPNGDGTSLYAVTVALPAGGPYIQEAVLPTGAVVASDTADDTLALVAAVSDPLSTVVVGSNPPITRGEAIDFLYTMGTVGPVHTLPSNQDPDTQRLHVYGKRGDSSNSAGRKVSATPISNQVLGQNLIDKQVLTATLDDQGYCYLTLIRGVSYVVTADWWGTYFGIAVTQDADKTLASYLV